MSCSEGGLVGRVGVACGQRRALNAEGNWQVEAERGPSQRSGNWLQPTPRVLRSPKLNVSNAPVCCLRNTDRFNPSEFIRLTCCLPPPPTVPPRFRFVDDRSEIFQSAFLSMRPGSMRSSNAQGERRRSTEGVEDTDKGHAKCQKHGPCWCPLDQAVRPRA